MARDGRRSSSPPPEIICLADDDFDDDGGPGGAAPAAPARAAPAAAPAAPPPTAAAPEVADKIERYSWDQTTKAVTIYIPVAGIALMVDRNAAEVKTDLEDRAFTFRLRDDKGAVSELKIPNLCQKINVATSKMRIKPDRVQLKLVKAAEGVEWSALDSAADEKRAERDQRIASGDLREASTQQLLADMYANATDEERVSLRGAAVTGAKKRGEIKV
ncbi:hypothetical protein M885DRAFT_514776 [Pelagophyceae sp. CCMP2097]|nr:hypothetical protein M885DRAFT_514776 [Pelagophyceae sp. CCMP2097]|mmetsp:Transcript_1388/g.5116  ORF Transcript_1388/g.5116 Transcript_1388/m.5116 type:complete len:217 (+) Transcript_1388:222-872(+)